MNTHPLATSFGQTLINILTAEHGADVTDAFVKLLVSPTLPGTADRIAQDKAFETMTRRLVAAPPKPAQIAVQTEKEAA